MTLMMLLHSCNIKVIIPFDNNYIYILKPLPLIDSGALHGTANFCLHKLVFDDKDLRPPTYVFNQVTYLLYFHGGAALVSHLQLD